MITSTARRWRILACTVLVLGAMATPAHTDVGVPIVRQHHASQHVSDGSTKGTAMSKLTADGLTLGNAIATVLGTIALSALLAFSRLVHHRFSVRRPLETLFGRSMLDGRSRNAVIAVDTYSLDRDGIADAMKTKRNRCAVELDKYPYVKRFPDGTMWRFSGAWEGLMGYCSCRGLLYLSMLITPLRRTPVPFDSDERTWEKWNGTVLAIGGPAANCQARRILDLASNRWYNLGKSPRSEEPALYRKSDNAAIHDEQSKRYGLILRLEHPDYPGHRLIVCAGIGEWGTSGACYYLLQHWRDLVRTHGGSDFAVCIEVDPGCDTSARQVRFDSVAERQRNSRLPLQALSTSLGMPDPRGPSTGTCAPKEY